MNIPIIGEKPKDELSVATFVVAIGCVSEVLVMRAQRAIFSDADILAATFQQFVDLLNGKQVPESMVPILDRAVDMAVKSIQFLMQARKDAELQAVKQHMVARATDNEKEGVNDDE